MIIIGAAIMIFSGSQIIFSQLRTGYLGKQFLMYKFRTMRKGAATEQRNFKQLNEANGPVFKIHNDPRFTRVGKFFAHTGLDELPQLINVLRGDMALIGPRPLPVSEAGNLKSWQKARNTVKPGIISPWILEGYHKQTFDAWMKSDIAYIKKKNFGYDVRLAAQTIILLLRFFFKEFAALS